MSTQIRWSHNLSILVSGLIALTMVSACAGRRVTTSVEDQAFQPGPAAAPVVEAAKVEPPPAAPPSEPPKAEPTPSARIEAPPVTAPPPPPAAEEVRVAEQPVAPVPPPKPALPPPQPAAELSDIYFDFDQYVVRADARSGLGSNAGILKSRSNEKIMIEGHCDERGTSAYNLVLGERRARSVKQYLEDLGVPASQMTITSYGKERPFCTEHSEECWQSNRRAHFRQP
ncbi:MAG TPA: peptidoglycan-associated lipoprotein Pal [Spirochaetia bacterium]|nr:peptidoglycan-associated lipoprotein Pal [Spirochaetia bacterium]